MKKIEVNFHIKEDNVKYSVEFEFYVCADKAQLILPLLEAGFIVRPDDYHQHFWAVDSGKNFWYGKEHRMEISSYKELTGYLSLKDRKIICGLLGLPIPLDNWMKTALEAGWRPPTQFIGMLMMDYPELYEKYRKLWPGG